ncbi:hypothetical protein CsSME_00042152 [Camellia sinensis var. sinensis]
MISSGTSSSTATLATGTPTAFHVRFARPIWVLDSEFNDHMTRYSIMSKGYRCCDPGTSRYYHSCDATFYEKTPFFGTHPSAQDSSFTLIPFVESDVRPLPIFHKVEAVSHEVEADAAPPSSPPLQKLFKWVSAMQTEMAVLEQNQTWHLVTFPSGEKTISCSWQGFWGYLCPDRQAYLYSCPYLSCCLTFLTSASTGCQECLSAWGLETIYMDPPPGFWTEREYAGKDQGMYQRLVGHLIYLTNTRPDLTFAVSVVSQFMHAPHTEHFDVVYHILWYLKTSPNLGLFFTANPQSGLSCFTDADYARSRTDTRSTSSFCTFYGDHFISWKSKKQVVVSKSSAKDKYRAMAQDTFEVLWLHSILAKLGFVEDASSPLFRDNKSAIMLLTDLILHERTKHIEVDIHFIQEKVRTSIVSPSFVSSSEQLANMFTKSADLTLFNHLLSSWVC